MDLAAAVIDYMELESITCDHATNGVASLELIERNQYQMIILDLNLPRMNGITVCKTLRSEGIDIPILMLTALDTLDDKVTGFKAGADDYLVKPFALVELVARVKALAGRRSNQVNLLKVADLSLDLNKKEATRNGAVLKLSPTGLKVLETLMFASPNPVTRQALIEKVWGEEQPDSNSLKVHIFKLRKAVDSNSETSLIHTLAGFGFTLREESDLNENKI